MSEFKRVLRYMMVKLSDIDLWPPFFAKDIRASLEDAADKVALQREKAGKSPFECVVVESDWPEYETVWEMIQRRMEGKPSPLDDLKNKLTAALAERDEWRSKAQSRDNDEEGAYYQGRIAERDRLAAQLNTAWQQGGETPSK